MVFDSRLRQLIADDANADELHAATIAEGMVSITQAAIALARSGAISLAQAWRVRAN